MSQFFCISCRSATDPDFKACPYCGEPITDFLRKYLREPIDGKYRILARLGIGGMGEVYKVLHVHLNTPRVIKLMRPNLIGDEKAHWRFVREARLATKITHPNVATLYDFSELDDGSWYMVWEYIEGVTFADLIRDFEVLHPRHAATLSIQALSGLHAIHKSGIVHRDISPENLMITRDEDGDELVKIIDLGIAKQWGDSADEKTKTGMFVGKWRYCSPEHLGLLKSGESIDGRADLYSYAIVLYQMLTGVPPFDAQTPHQFVVLHSTTPPPSLASNNIDLEGLDELEAIISRGLEKDRELRFATARQFSSALKGALPDLPEEDANAAEEHRSRIESLRLADAIADDESLASPSTVPSSLLPADDAPTRIQEEPTLATAPQVSSSQTSETRKEKLPAETGKTFAAATLDGEGPSTEFEDSLVQATLARPQTDQEEPASSRIRWVLGSLAVTLLLVAAFLWFWRSPEPTPPAPPVDRSATLAVNALPWAEIVSVTNVETGELAVESDGTTPARYSLAPGLWEVTLAHPASGETATRRVELSGGGRMLVEASFVTELTPELPVLRGSAAE